MVEVLQWLKYQKHPRIRGESQERLHGPRSDGETSPHTRGKLEHKFLYSKQLGNIPAYAGKAASGSGKLDGGQKHPRIRGES